MRASGGFTLLFGPEDEGGFNTSLGKFVRSSFSSCSLSFSALVS